MGVLDNLKVLVVDDQHSFLDLATEMLHALGVTTVVQATSGQRALELLNVETSTLNCVLCDVSMAEDNGFSLLMSIRSGQARHVPRDIPIVLVTVHSDAEFVDTAKRLGATGYLVKPLSAEKLRDAMRPDRLTNIFQWPTSPFGHAPTREG